jgi:single-strand DNA-binding protein
MAGRNLVILVGNLGRDCETKYTKDGKAVCNFSLAVNERKDQDTEWFNIVAWEKLAEICQKYLQKGSQIYVEGRQKTETWDKDGEKKYKQTIVINNMTMLGQAGGGNQRTNSSPADDELEDSVPF